ncbi:Histone acetyltransferase HPA2/related acetyltransferase [Hahella chejuensis KCTC 2396]|uniref:Histone acetyltransferase HPA2/related acetyltransferase n=1 Tax=Hahella chejuensis (strain KCTC 2396) TaxID=349521 RepID=Q2SE73_HAHCH|nr:GNAT family N-acetyltransferase [Hahella chejuensis]ABC31051.1 Histone acetyltransferase HPA2/related acetyltransferase [Hahella chejuensis KCTC 2396]
MSGEAEQMKFLCLKHTQADIARELYELFQSAYRVEAKLIGVEQFPPLRRTAADIMRSSTQFLGYRQVSRLVAAVEIERQGEWLSIHSLVVVPDMFRQGFANGLLEYVFTQSHQFGRAKGVKVSTAAVNAPAISLYERFGFRKVGENRTPEGISVVSFEALF